MCLGPGPLAYEKAPDLTDAKIFELRTLPIFQERETIVYMYSRNFKTQKFNTKSKLLVLVINCE